MNAARPPRRWVVRGVVLLVVLSLLAPAAASAVSDRGHEAGQLQSGTVERAANGSTIIAVQGFHFQGRGAEKKPARVVSVGPEAKTEWVYNGSAGIDTRWFYDVDPLPSGNLLVTATNPSGTVVFELDRETREVVWTERLDIHDTHDVAYLNETHLVVANMRAYNETTGVSNDRVFVYNRETDEITWEWTFREHYDNETDGGFREDWTHVNDVDVLDDQRLLLSPRNFDQVIVVNRSTNEIEQRLGADDDHEILNEQHNPDYMETEDGNPVILVADSENDRVVEYTKIDGDWERTWVMGSSQTLNWPRDADRLPNGNTLIVDSLNHRVIEVTPRGKVVWEYYATWGPYDVERPATGQGSTGPTMHDRGVTGKFEIYNSAGGLEGGAASAGFAVWLSNTATGTPLEGPVREFARTWAHVTPWIKPVWLDSWGFVSLVAALLVLLGWGVAEAVYQRQRLAESARGLADRTKQRYVEYWRE